MMQHILIEKLYLTSFAAYAAVFFPAKLNCDIYNFCSFKCGGFSAILGKEGEVQVQTYFMNGEEKITSYV